MVVSLLLPGLAVATPEVWLVIGVIEPSDPPDPTVASEAFRPEAGAVALHEGAVTVMPTCDALMNLGFRSSEGASPHEKIVVRLQKKRIASGCALEVLEVRTDGRRSRGAGASEPRTHGTNYVPSMADARHPKAKDVPCGTELIEVRQGRLGGSSLSVHGLGESGDCHEDPGGMDSPLSTRWLDPPFAEAPNGVMPPATAPR